MKTDGVPVTVNVETLKGGVPVTVNKKKGERIQGIKKSCQKTWVCSCAAAGIPRILEVERIKRRLGAARKERGEFKVLDL